MATTTDTQSPVPHAADSHDLIRVHGAHAVNVASVDGSGGISFVCGDKTITEKASFSRTGGMCPRCEGRGSVSDFDLSALYDDSKSLNEGALTIPGYSM